MLDMKPDNIILEAICGSRAYGLATEASDTDVKGIFIAPTREILSIPMFKPKQVHDHTDPDWSYMEVEKFVHLALKCNPTLTELLWMEAYLVLEPMGKMLVDNRHLFLSTKYVHDAYKGYCWSQAHHMILRGGNYGNGMSKRYEKNTRHLLRLLFQGKELLSTGSLTVRVTPDVREELFAAGKLPPDKVMDLFTKELEKFDNIKSVLPDEPDYEGVNKLLLKIRKGNW
jgi:predicted nucleotidyltransferase